MPARKMVPKLQFPLSQTPGLVELFRRVDELGGWPVEFRFIGFEHTEQRCCGFTNSSACDGYWTIIAHADDYYLWKLSPSTIERMIDEVIKAIYIKPPKTSSIRFTNYRGYTADLSVSAEKETQTNA